ncbi:glycoside hydrolase [Chaetomidium leptoderma]|uniref:Glycoside hydrolase n=1 Tax=Chaetomidium leptoderma TaxID=669021 RepID=A0AAN6ZXK3_9PEZI|nr:glycoside hydrolase [Chaetomidium leptoderma]
MTTFIATYPPLGQVTTQLQDTNVPFYAVLEVPRELATAPWQLALWHSNNNGWEWAEVEFTPTPDAPDARPTELHEASGAKARLYFTAKLAVRSSVTFTVKFRQGTGDEEWRWVQAEQGSDDGVVVVDQRPTRDNDPEDLPDLIQELNPDLKWRGHMSQSPGTRLWSIEAGVGGATDEESAYAEVPLGIPWGRFLRWFALVRPWSPWLVPRHGKAEFGLDKDALLCSFLSPQGKHLVFLGMSGVNDVTTLFRSGDSGRLMLHIRSDNGEPTAGVALVAVGDNLESTIAAVMYHARTLVMAANTSAATQDVAETTAGSDIRPQWYENWYDGLGYCTWNSLGQNLTEKKVLDALDELAENKINISSLIIDDNWQDIDYRGDSSLQHGWNDFEAEPKKFPGGLKALVSNIRSKHKNIQHIAVWHALLGYWGGLAPDGPLAKRYKTIQVVRNDTDKAHLPTNDTVTVVAGEDIQTFYNDFYRFLSSCSINGVKTDAQYMLDTLPSPPARRALTKPYLDAWTLASLRHFSNRVIACMALTPPLLFHTHLPHTTRPQTVCRNSDDYFPSAAPDDDDDDDDEAAAHPWHVWTNAHNALLTQHLNVVPDWDMFQTVHDYAGFHAAARCVSGGPVCITDVEGEHDLALLRQITGVTPRGKTVVFRPDVVGRAIMDGYYVGFGGSPLLPLLKVGAYHGRAALGTGIVGVFNVSSPAAEGPLAVTTEVIPLARFPGVLAGEGRRYVVRAHGSGRVSPPLEVGAPASMLTVSLGARGYDVLCSYPLTAVASRTRGEVLLANLGLVGKMTGCAAVVRTVFEARGNGRMLVGATLKALGVLGIYISVLPELSIGDDFMVTIQGQPVPPHTVSVNKQDGHVLDVDVETAWEEMALESGWANEVEAKVYFALERK